MPGNVVDAVAEALEYETFNCTPGFQISRLSVQRGGQNAVLDAHMRLPGEVRDYCAQYGEDNPLSFGIQFNAVVPATALRAEACALHPQTERGRQKPMLSLVTH